MADITPLLISDTSRKIMGLTGLALIAVSVGLFYLSPNRVSTEVNIGPSGEVTRKTTTAESDPSSTVLALLLAGVGLLTFGINGVKLTKFSTPIGGAEAGDLSTADQQRKSEEPRPLPLGPTDAIALLRGYLRLSSWNGIKVMYIAAKTAGRAGFNFKDLCSRDSRMSHDYAFAYLVSSSSLGLFAHSSDASGTTIRIWNYPQVVAEELNAEIDRRFAVDPLDAPIKRAEIARLEAFASGVPSA